MVIFLFRGLTDGWRVVLTVLPKFYYKINDMLSLGHSGSGPVMFFDFLTRLYDIGGVVSVMALSSLFILMTLHGLEYSYFYEQLLASCLKSYLLLAYLAAAFAKKLRRLALSVLPAEALVIVAPFHNLLRRHPSIKCLVHREDGESEAKDDLKMEEQIVGNRNDSTGTDLPKKPGFDHFRDASGRSKSLKPEVDLKAKNMNLLYILLVPSATKIAKKIKLKFTKAWISFLRLPLPLNVYKELLVSFFKSPFLPAYLAAVFAEKLSQLALSVLPAGALVIVSPIHNLLRWHSSINCLVHRVLSATKIAKKIELKCTKAWISFLRLPLPLDVYKELLVSCLKSPLLPAYLAAAFAKKLSRLALSVLQAGALVIVSPIHNLFRRHPSINCLVHRESSKRMSTRSLFYFHRGHLLLLLAFVLSDTVTMALGDKGIASYYTPPYERTDCYGVGSSQFPENKLFAAVGDKLWDLGAACGREYEVRCISKAQSGPGSCKPGSGTIRVKIVDNALSVESAAAAGPKQSVTGADLVLSQTAFEAIANPSMASINVEFKEV
ncbi:uncharacterized protein LOC115681562 isoform X6 [Syzygium oleosum]|uniref:uncharacterized protein LOC115681562 isoform X6 n=1 Tax=Syzygium oleosum TaxID=219896 RepID=UPI0024B8C431|nr:uncharacterized protein LOC115681562 isoform X6 [Syzygium oleosum]